MMSTTSTKTSNKTTTTSQETQTMTTPTMLRSDFYAIRLACENEAAEILAKYADRLSVKLPVTDSLRLRAVVGTILAKHAPTLTEATAVCEVCESSTNEMLETTKCAECFFTCRRCKEVLSTDEKKSGTDSLCLECTVECNECGRIDSIDDAEWCARYTGDVNRWDYLCEECGGECDTCGEVERRDDMGHRHDDHETLYCERCSTECGTCAERIGDDEMEMVGDEMYCPYCLEAAKEHEEERKEEERKEAAAECVKDIEAVILAALRKMRPEMSEDELSVALELDAFEVEVDNVNLHEAVQDALSR